MDYDRLLGGLGLRGDLNDPSVELQRKLKEAIRKQPVRFINATTEQDVQHNVLRIEALIDLDTNYSRSVALKSDPLGQELWDELWDLAGQMLTKHRDSLIGRSDDSVALSNMVLDVNKQVSRRVLQFTIWGVLDTSRFPLVDRKFGVEAQVTDGLVSIVPNADLMELYAHLLYGVYQDSDESASYSLDPQLQTLPTHTLLPRPATSIDMRGIDTSKIHRVQPWPEDK